MYSPPSLSICSEIKSEDERSTPKGTVTGTTMTVDDEALTIGVCVGIPDRSAQPSLSVTVMLYRSGASPTFCMRNVKVVEAPGSTALLLGAINVVRYGLKETVRGII